MMEKAESSAVPYQINYRPKRPYFTFKAVGVPALAWED